MDRRPATAEPRPSAVESREHGPRVLRKVDDGAPAAIRMLPDEPPLFAKNVARMAVSEVLDATDRLASGTRGRGVARRRANDSEDGSVPQVRRRARRVDERGEGESRRHGHGRFPMAAP